MHGGTSPISFGSPSFKHGWYSRYQPWVNLRRQVEERDRRERWVAARMKEIRAQRAEIEARREAEREKNPIDWERIGPVMMRLQCGLTEEVDTPDDPDQTQD